MKRKRKAAALLWVLILLTLCPGKALGAQEDPYSLVFPERGTEIPYDYLTPFRVEHTILGRNGYASESAAPRIFRLVEENGHSVSGYGADVAAGMEEGARYRRINLEDSPYFSDAAAGKLRAVVEESFPRCQLETLQERASTWLEARDLPEVTNLQSGEAILAAQIAIWKLSGGNRYSVNALYGGVSDLGDLRESVTHTEALLQGETEHTAQNVSGLYTYFINLEPMAPADILISEASITRTVYSCAQEMDGGWSAQVSVTINGEIGEGDALTMTATCEGQTQVQPLTEEGEYAFPFHGLTQRGEVVLELSGVQHGADVYLFESKGKASQTLLGYDDSVMPVFCRRVLTPVPSAAPAVPESSKAE